ncbi:DUF5047 domain-containing protein [Timonella senegalensis]|uniref:DUF5047 domain-containing protein n=1 Tax=Timonella senegalensis TaxID=1465825 RepID=UPI002FDE3180
MQGVSDAFLAALTQSHQIKCEARLVKGRKTLRGNLPVIDGEVSVSLDSDVRWSLRNLQVPAKLVTQDYQEIDLRDLIGTEGHEIHLRIGLVFYDGTEEWTSAGVYRVDERPDLAHAGEPLSISGSSRECYVVDDEFLYARTIEGPSGIALIIQLIRESLPQAEVSVSTARNAKVPAFMADRSRWSAIKTIAQAVGVVVHTDGEGRFVIADAPSLDAAPVWTFKTGTGGTLTKVEASKSRADVRNAVVVRGVSPSGDYAPLQGVAYDEHPSSPTRWGDPDAGAFGKVPMFIDNPAVTSVAQAQSVGRAELARRSGISRTMQLQSVPNPALEAGDAVLVIPDDSPAGASARLHIIDSISMSLRAGGGYSITTRDVRSHE